MTDAQVTALRSGKSRGRPFSRANAAQMGRRGGLQASANREEQLHKVREALYAAAPAAAERLARVALGKEHASQVEIQALSSVLDRTIGKTTQVEIDTPASALFMEAIMELADDP